jgi:hypothetical protein
MQMNYARLQKFLPGVILGLMLVFAFTLGLNSMKVNSTTTNQLSLPASQSVSSNSTEVVTAPVATENATTSAQQSPVVSGSQSTSREQTKKEREHSSTTKSGSHEENEQHESDRD